MASSAHFGPELFDFIRDLRENNDRDWFKANKSRYERDVKDPMLRFISDFAPKLREITPHLRADPRPVGGSLFRIHRDVRFSKNKEPYKTHVSAQFRHKSGKDVHAPGFYLHLEPEKSLSGIGIWQPQKEALANIRQRIVDHASEYDGIVGAAELTAVFEPDGDTLKRAPKGFDPDHPQIEALKRKDHAMFSSFTEAEVVSPDFLDVYTERCRLGSDYMRFLAKALGIDW